MKYIIQHPVTLKYFEQDFAGWSWQSESRLACKFKSLEGAKETAAWLAAAGEEYYIIEV